MSLAVAVLKEQTAGEHRVALDPASANQLAEKGFKVLIEKGAGEAAGFSDEQYTECVLLDDPELIVTMADIWLWVRVPATEHLANLPDGRLGIGLVYPHRNPAVTDTLNQHNLTCVAMERVPRNSNTRSMDVLSSQATVAGYSAVLRAAQLAPRMFPLLTTAAGTVNPARVVILGAGVAGLQAIATARRLGAHVEVYDDRSTVREQVESLGATMIVATEIATAEDFDSGDSPGVEDDPAPPDILAQYLGEADVVISTIETPGAPAPKLISQAMVEGMKRGSTIVDLAAESGGNCELTVAGETLSHHGVLVDGPVNLASGAAHHASVMYARSLLDILELLVEGENIVIDHENEVIESTLLTHAGKLARKDTTEAQPGASAGD